MQAFQSLMLLGALLPSACNAYASILEMVDDEAAAAAAAGCALFFSLKRVGGLRHDDEDPPSPSASSAPEEEEQEPVLLALRRLDGRHLEPDTWRRAVRAVLKMDVYGPAAADGPTTTTTTHKGLWQVVAQLEEAARRRHQIADELLASGLLPPRSRYLMAPASQPPCPPEQRNCVRIVETARMALERLVIS
ncbi:hypothetical protein CDD83_4659 [Cordyceps sp. RAO-2017]|nr:hypothetical protein CDD83_4659 [Cordyceps sp. RAO-2017]